VSNIEKFNRNFQKDIKWDDIHDVLQKHLQNMNQPIGVPIEGGKSYTVSSAPNGVIFFDNLGNIVGRAKGKNDEFTFETPNECRYLRFLC
jgi:hypothetical protein